MSEKELEKKLEKELVTCELCSESYLVNENHHHETENHSCDDCLEGYYLANQNFYNPIKEE